MIDLNSPSDQERAQATARAAVQAASDLEETKKLRMIAAAITGPTMVYAGLERPMPKLLKALMITVGVGIIASNVDKIMKQQAESAKINGR